MTDKNPLSNLLREMMLAVAMIAFLVLGLWAHTGTMPPLVVVESSSMVHEEKGEVGSIDAGDLILVMDTPYENIITFAEASDENNKYHGYETHGMEGDVIIYQKNGDDGTPIIHRAILRVEPSQTTSPNRLAPSDGNNSQHCPDGGTWDDSVEDEDGGLGTCVLTWAVPGTNITDSETITIRFDGNNAGYYDCNRFAHANVEPYLVVWNWQPKHSGIVTLGDNNQCSVDQGGLVVNGSSGVHSASGVAGPVKEDWLVGVAGGEIPWLGTVKLMLSGSGSPGTQYVPGSSFLFLSLVIGGIIFAPIGLEIVLKKVMQKSPEMHQAKYEFDHFSEEE
ncbi:MAG: S26 family signal peptidase [Candidatus Thermoplasmatota archaeon]|nr:S26 family signal peptidase [Candidatus Thermoplasmatota archaeon]